MKKLIFVLIFAMLALPTFAQQGTFAEPTGAELDKFPIKTSSLSLAEQAELGLSAKKLDAPVVVQNYFRNIRSGRFVLETLPAGTLVLIDKKGNLRYKADCGNRLVEIPLYVALTYAVPQVPKKGGAWSRFWDAVGRTWGNMWEGLGSFLGFLLPLLLILALLGLLGYLIYRVLQNWQDGRRVPPLQPVPPAPAPVVPPGPAPNPLMPVPPAGGPQPVPRAFSDDGFLFERGERNVPSRIQIGRNVGRVEVTENNADGSVTLRVFGRR